MEQIAPPVLVVGWAPDGALRILDQRLLPGELRMRDLHTVEEVAEAIRTLAVRGAPAIGVAAAIGLAVAAGGAELAEVERAATTLRATRPTAVNLAWALDRILGVARAHSALAAPARRDAMREEAERIRAQDAAMCLAIGEHGAALIESGMRILTHCNAGALATAGIGTALAPLYVAHSRGAKLQVYACETRPLLQGSRLTAWELTQAGIPVTVLTDSMAAGLMARGEVDLVIVGADRIAANGDVANKIGTYGLAVLAKHHGVPFVVAAPMSSVDPHMPDGSAIVIEQRDPAEVTHLNGVRIAAEGALVHNPAFDVTPHTLVTRIVTDRGVFCPPYVFAPNSAVLPPPA